MFFRGAFGAALLAVPLTGLAGQTPSQHMPPAAAQATVAADDSSSAHRVAWIAGAGVAGAAMFTTFVRLSEQSALGTADRAVILPASPVPSHYTDGTLSGNGVSLGQNTPVPAPPDTTATAPTDSVPQSPGAVTDDAPEPIITDIPLPPPPQLQALPVLVTAPEPGSIALLGTGLAALVPLVRRRRSGGRLA